MDCFLSKPVRHPLVFKAGRRLRQVRRSTFALEASSSSDSIAAFSMHALCA